MKLWKAATLVVIVSGATSASAMTQYVNGVLFGNVCRQWSNGVFGPMYTVYPWPEAQPVGSACPVRDNYGNVVAPGMVSNE